MASCISASHGGLTAIQSGYLDDPATWGVIAPDSTSDLLNSAGYDIVLTNAFTTTGSYQSYGGALEVQSTGALTAYLQHLNGGVTVNGGSLVSAGGGRVTFGQVGPTTLTITNGGNVNFDGQVVCGKNGSLFTMNHNSGTVVANQWFLLKEATLNINASSSLTVLGQLAFEGSASANVFVNSGGELTVNWVDFQAGGSYEEKITLNGGVFNVMNVDTVAMGSSLNFAGPNASVQFDAGLIVWQGITNATQYALFTNVYNDWVDAGRITSSMFNDQQLAISN